jgi:uncharacterized protein
VKIELDSNVSGKNKVSAYSSEGLLINDVLYQTSIVLTPEQIVTDWPPQRFVDLAAQHFAPVIELSPEIVLLGTGKQLQFPDTQTLSPLVAENIGFEIMDTGAACRAYNFLMGEGRKVVAALLTIEA